MKEFVNGELDFQRLLNVMDYVTVRELLELCREFTPDKIILSKGLFDDYLAYALKVIAPRLKLEDYIIWDDRYYSFSGLIKNIEPHEVLLVITRGAKSGEEVQRVCFNFQIVLLQCCIHKSNYKHWLY